MKSLRAEELLSVWEQALSQPLLQRVLLLLVAAFPERPAESFATMSIGERDLLLLHLRECLFGSQLINTTICPHCSERIEWRNSVADLVVEGQQDNAKSDVFELQTDDYQLSFRLPNSADVELVVNSDNAQQSLLSRCVLESQHRGDSCGFEQLPEAVIQTLTERIEMLDPQADIRIALTCPQCEHRWDALFDIASFLWTEVNDWAERMLQTVNQLARVYGWSEGEILNLSPVRRQLYLGMVAS